MNTLNYMQGQCHLLLIVTLLMTRWMKVELPLAARISANLQERSDITAEVMSSSFEVVVIWTGGNQYTSMCGEAYYNVEQTNYFVFIDLNHHLKFS